MAETSQKRSRKQEDRTAKKYGGNRNVLSGAGWTRKNDVWTEDISFELKTTTKSQYALKAAELLLAERNALLDGRMMVFGIEFVDGRTWITLSEEDFMTLLEAGQSDRNETPDRGPRLD